VSFIVLRRPDGPRISIKISDIAPFEEVPPRGHPNRGILEQGTRIRLICGRMQDVQEPLVEVASRLASSTAEPASCR